MKRLFVLSLVAVLGVGLLSVGGFAQVTTEGDDTETETTTIYWEYSGVVSCDVTLDVHDDVDLGSSSLNNATLQKTGNTVETSGNCDHTLSVEADGYDTPIDNEVFNDFSLKLESASNASSTGHIDSSWVGFNWGSATYDGTGNDSTSGSWELGSVDVSNGNVVNTDWDMKYRYEFDEDDQNGDYEVDLEYTLSTQ